MKTAPNKKKPIFSSMKRMDTGGVTASPWQWADKNQKGISAVGQFGAATVDAFAPTDSYGVRSNGAALGSGALSGAATGASIGSAIPVIGTAAGAVVGGVIGGVTGLLGNEKAKKEKGIAIDKSTTAQLMNDKQMSDARIAGDPGLKYGRLSASYYRFGGVMKNSPATLPRTTMPMAAVQAKPRLMPNITESPNRQMSKRADGGPIMKPDATRTVRKPVTNFPQVGTDDQNLTIGYHLSNNSLDDYPALGPKRFKQLYGRNITPIESTTLAKRASNRPYDGKMVDLVLDENARTKLGSNAWGEEISNSYFMPPPVTSPKLSKKANGGSIEPLSSSDIKIEGASHENGGVKFPSAGVELEGGETVNNGFVFSKKLGFAKPAEAVARQLGKAEKRPGSPINNSTVNALQRKTELLKVHQEAAKASAGIPSDLPKMGAGGAVPDPPLSTKFKNEWNGFTDWMNTTGQSNNPQLDIKSKSLGADAIKQYMLQNKTTQLSPDSVTRVQQELQDYRTNALQKVKTGKVVLEGTESDFMNDLSPVDGWPGTKTVSRRFPTAMATKTTSQGTITKKYGVDTQAYDRDLASNKKMGDGGIMAPGSKKIANPWDTNPFTALIDKTKLNILPEVNITATRIKKNRGPVIPDATGDIYAKRPTQPAVKSVDLGTSYTPSVPKVGVDINGIADKVSPFLSNYYNATQKLPLPPVPQLNSDITPNLVDYSASRNEAVRSARSADASARTNLNSGAAVSATKAANLAGQTRAISQINEAENNQNASIRNSTAAENAQIRAGNTALQNNYQNSLVERQIKGQALKSANIANLEEKVQGMAKDKKMFDLEGEKAVLGYLANNDSGAGWEAARPVVAKHVSVDQLKQMDDWATKRRADLKEERLTDLKTGKLQANYKTSSDILNGASAIGQGKLKRTGTETETEKSGSKTTKKTTALFN